MSNDYSDFFKVFTRVSRAIHGGDNTDEILEIIVTNIKEILGAKGCIFWIVDNSSLRIEKMISHGFPYRNLTHVDYPTLSRIFSPGAEPFVYIEDATNDPRIPSLDSIGKKSVGSIAGMFFEIVGSCTGILAVYFYNVRKLGEKETQILSALGEQGAIALQRARSYDEKMLQNLRQMVEGLTLALEAKDESTHGHSVKVAGLARLVAQQMSLPKQLVETIYHGGLLHDIGKIGMNDDILERLGILSRHEMDIVKQHPVIGARIAKPLSFLDDVVPLILHHHERFDGSGYPDGLRGSGIPLGARIMTVCDAFETMLAGRKNFARMSVEDSVVNLYQGAGHQFDPEIVAALFEALLKDPESIEQGGNGSSGISCLKNYREKLKTRTSQPVAFFI